MTYFRNGLTPTRLTNGAAGSGATRTFPIANAYGSTIYQGDPVTLNGGVLVLATNTTKPIGVFMGCVYADAQGKIVDSPYYPSGTTSNANVILDDGVSTQPLAIVAMDPDQVYAVKADGALTAAALGEVRAAASIGSGSTATGRSAVVLDADSTPATDAAALFRIVGLVNEPGNAWTNTQPVVEVILENWGYQE